LVVVAAKGKFHALALEEEKKRKLAEESLRQEEATCNSLRKSMRDLEERLAEAFRERERKCLYTEELFHCIQVVDERYKKQGEKLADVSQQLRELTERGFTKAKEKEFIALQKTLGDTQTSLELAQKKLSTSVYRVNELNETVRDLQAQIKAYFAK
jgi:chromosome segregation ATPase